MKIRTNYVSNSSSSSFLVAKDYSDITPCIKLPDEIWKAIDKHYIDEDGTKLNLSEKSNEWWLTTLISDCSNEYSKIYNKKNSILYLDGHEEPYDWYDNPNSYTVFKKDFHEFFIKNHDLFYFDMSDIPSCIEMKETLKKILSNNHLNKTQKLNAIKDYLN